MKTPGKKTNVKKPLKVNSKKSKKSLNAESPNNDSMLDSLENEKLTEGESVTNTRSKTNDTTGLQEQSCRYETRVTRGSSNKLLPDIKPNKLDITGSNQPGRSTTGKRNKSSKTADNSQDNIKKFKRLKNNDYKCVKCDFIHSMHQKVRFHFDKSHSTNVYKCKLCPYETTQQYYLNTHTKFHSKPDVECPYCQKMIKQFSYKTHIKVHERNDQTEYKCDECDYKSYNHANVKRHSMTHMDFEDLTQYNCDKCDYVTVYKNSLTIHKLVHDEGKSMQCSECDYRTANSNYLRRHILINHKKTKVKCPQCTQMFTSNWNLKNHIKRMHVDENEKRYYYCELCPKESQYKSTERANLRRHILVHRTMDEIEVFACDKCSYIGKTKNGLRIHFINAHLPEMHTHKCDICGYSTITKSRYRLHLKDVHGKSKRFKKNKNVSNEADNGEAME